LVINISLIKIIILQVSCFHFDVLYLFRQKEASENIFGIGMNLWQCFASNFLWFCSSHSFLTILDLSQL